MKREKFTPEAHKVYINNGGGMYRCIMASEECATMQNVRTGWTFNAIGCGIHDDGTIDWYYSTGGHFAKSKMRIYGSMPTQLKLTTLAKTAYDNTDPLTIIEVVDDYGDVIHYRLQGFVNDNGLTADEVNEKLESLLTFKIKPEHLEAFGPDADEDTELKMFEIRYLARGWDMPVEDVISMLTIEGI